MADDKDNNEYILIKILIFFRRLIHDQQNGKRDEITRDTLIRHWLIIGRPIMAA